MHTKLAIQGLVGLTILAAIFGSSYRVYQVEHQAAEAQTIVACEQAAFRVEDYVRARLQVVDLMARQRSRGQLADPDAFTDRALLAQDEFGGYQAINWIDESGTIQWVAPREPNKSALGKSVFDHPIAKTAASQAWATGAPHTTAALTLFQGGQGFAAYFPVNVDGVQTGMVNGVFRSQFLVEQSLRAGILNNYELRIQDQNASLYETGDIERASTRLLATHPVSVMDRTWTLELAPNDALYAQLHPGAHRPIFLAGILFGLALLMLMVLDTRRSQLLMERGRLAGLIEASQDLHLLANQRGEIDYINHAGEQLLQSPHATLDAMVPDCPHNRATLDSGSLLETVQREGKWQGELLFHSQDTQFPVYAQAVHLGAGGIALQATDLRNQKKLEDELRQSQKLEALGRLAGGVAHDFNNLLTALIGYAELVAMHPNLPDLVYEDLSAIRSAAMRGADLTRNLLTFSRRQVSVHKVIQLGTAVPALRPMLAQLIPARITLCVSLAKDAGAVVMDPVQLEQILMNLVVNAVHATRNEGQITLSVKAQGPWMVLAIQDTGTGMTEEVRAKALEPFFTTKPAGTGTGLGLSSVYGIVHQHLGKLVIDSKLDEGTRVEVWLPRSDAISEGDVNTPEPLPQGAGRILLVEDEESVRNVTKTLLTRQNYDVTTASDGAVALEIFDANPKAFDLLISDVVMPMLGGVELVREIRKRNSSLPALLCSGYVDASLSEEDLDHLDARFLAKPYTPQQLITLVQARLGQRPASQVHSRNAPEIN